MRTLTARQPPPGIRAAGETIDEVAMKDLGARMAAQNGYRNIHGWQLYDTTGTTEDWSYAATGGYGYTFEIGPNEFHPPFAEVVDVDPEAGFMRTIVPSIGGPPRSSSTCRRLPGRAAPQLLAKWGISKGIGSESSTIPRYSPSRYHGAW